MFWCGLYMLIGAIWVGYVTTRAHRLGRAIPHSDNAWVSFGILIGMLVSVIVWPILVTLFVIDRE